MFSISGLTQLTSLVLSRVPVSSIADLDSLRPKLQVVIISHYIIIIITIIIITITIIRW